MGNQLILCRPCLIKFFFLTLLESYPYSTHTKGSSVDKVGQGQSQKRMLGSVSLLKKNFTDGKR